jgi:thiol-disulfide isomerase/thioredoxin
MSRFHRYGLAAIALSLAIAPAVASAQVTPAQCLIRATRAIRTAPRAPDGSYRFPDSVRTQSIAAVQGCIGTFVVDSTAAGQLIPLAKLYAAVGREADVRAALTRRTRLLPDSQATTLLAGTQLFAPLFDASPSAAARVHVATTYFTQLDALGAPAAAERVEGAMALSDYFRTQNRDDEAARYANLALAASSQVSAAARPALTGTLLQAYLTVAGTEANGGHPDAALATLARATRAIGGDRNVDAKLAQMVVLYGLIGKPAPALSATYWYTAHGVAAPVTLSGKATVLAFGAHWCGPCRASYPSIIRMAAAFKGKPVQFVLATNTYGYFDDHAALTGPQEAAYDTAYFFGEHQLPVTLAVSESVTSQDDEGRVRDKPSANDVAYSVPVLPTTYIIDRRGIVRAVFVGWSPLNEATITALVKRSI